MSSRVQPLGPVSLQRESGGSSFGVAARVSACLCVVGVSVGIGVILGFTLHLWGDGDSSAVPQPSPPPPPSLPAGTGDDSGYLGLPPGLFVLSILVLVWLFCFLACIGRLTYERSRRPPATAPDGPDAEFAFPSPDKRRAPVELPSLKPPPPLPPPPPPYPPPGPTTGRVVLPPLRHEDGERYDPTDEVRRVFNWYKVGPPPMALETRHLPAAVRAIGLHVDSGQLGEALARYEGTFHAPERIELAELRTLVEQLKPLDETLRTFALVDRDHSADLEPAHPVRVHGCTCTAHPLTCAVRAHARRRPLGRHRRGRAPRGAAHARSRGDLGPISAHPRQVRCRPLGPHRA